MTPKSRCCQRSTDCGILTYFKLPSSPHRWGTWQMKHHATEFGIAGMELVGDPNQYSPSLSRKDHIEIRSPHFSCCTRHQTGFISFEFWKKRRGSNKSFSVRCLGRWHFLPPGMYLSLKMKLKNTYRQKLHQNFITTVLCTCIYIHI